MDALAHLGNDEQHIKELLEFIRIPSIGADPAHDKDTRRAATWLQQRLKKAGMENVHLVETSGHPAILADYLHAPGAPTVLVYGHYDVQPAKKEDGWEHDPFNARVEAGRIWGRGATDDKGQLLAHALAAEAWIRAGGPPVNLKMVFEGEEESGSKHFHELIESLPERLKADVLLVSDSMMHAEGRPGITYSLRGLTYLQLNVQGPRGDLHSGTWGGVLWNPIEALIHILASCKDPKSGRILIDGFYDDVVKPTRHEREALKEGVQDADVRAGAGVSALFGEEGYTSQERIGIRPTFEVNGIWGGYQGAGSKTVIPATAHAKLSCRLVANQDPVKTFEQVRAHLIAHAPAGVTVDVEHLNHGHPVRADPEHPYLQAVAKALEEAFGHAPALIPEGGTIPAVALLQELGAVPVLAGFANRDENMHAPGENFRVASFLTARQACVRMLGHLATT